jgi:pSer/pThr/pTyr-binding forkhead associated (FHA) protein
MAKLSVMFGSSTESEHNLDKPEIRIGRSADCDIVVDNLGISRTHCTIVQEGADFVVVDGGSNNGTFVGGKRITRHILKHGDKIILGKHSLVFDANGQAAGGPANKKKAAMGGEMTMFVDQAALAKAMANDGKRMAVAIFQGGREVLVPIVKEETSIGGQADIPAKGFLVKPVQARIVKSAAGHRIIAAGGWRAVRVNGQKLVGERELKPSDLIEIAGTKMTYRSA